MNILRALTRISLLSAALGAVSPASRAGLIHRYSFTGNAKDSVGRVDGTLQGAGASLADGRLVLANDSTSTGDKVSRLEFAGPVLPAAGTSASLLVWFTAKDGGDFARVLNFGASEGTEGVQFIYFTPRNADGSARVAITGSDVSSKTYLDFMALDDGKPHCVAIVIDGAAGKLRVFADGKEAGPAEALGANTLDKVRPVQNWLGRSSFAADPGLAGTIDELRVYDQALTAEEVAALCHAGPDALPPAAAKTVK